MNLARQWQRERWPLLHQPNPSRDMQNAVCDFAYPPLSTQAQQLHFQSL
jgi:hypothetical protein